MAVRSTVSAVTSRTVFMVQAYNVAANRRSPHVTLRRPALVLNRRPPTRRRPAAAQPTVATAGAPTALERVAEVGTMLFPVWALISGGLAFFQPSSLNWMTVPQFEAGVGLLMLSMGLSLSTDDFRNCAKNPVPILLGFACQYCLLPLLAFTIARAANLSPAFSTGLILLGCCPGEQSLRVAGIDVGSHGSDEIVLGRPTSVACAGGQASNVATFVARGDVALSVLMTTASTVAAAVMTPALASLLAGQFIPVDAWGLAESTVRLVLLPTLAGVTLNELFKSKVDRVRPAMPLLALALTVVLCAVPVAQCADVLRSVGGDP